MTQTRTDILIAGGGIAGLTAAAACAAAGREVTLVSPAPPVTEETGDGSDLRSTAFLQPARALFDAAGLWPHLADKAVALDGLAIVDTVGWPPEIRDSREFRAADIVDGPFGWNLLNVHTNAALMRALKGRPGVTLRFGCGFADMVPRDGEVIARLTDGSRVRARLVLGMDGRNSAVRQAAGIGVDVTRYGQTALAFTVSHPVPHANVSTEIYNTGGPFTMVPLPDVNGQPASAIVWMNPSAEAQRIAALPETEIATLASQRSCYSFGPLTLLSGIRAWPITSQKAAALTAQRTAILAEAAHVVPPIGAQGLNTSLNDLAALLKAMEGAADPGADSVLTAYEKARRTDIAARVAAIDLFNRVTRSGLPALQSLRLTGLKAVHDAAPVRKAVMRAGMGG